MSRNSKRIWPHSSSRSSKVIDLGVNGKPMCDFLLVVNNCNFSRICYRFRDFRLKDRKLLISPTPPFFDAPARGDPFRILWWNLASENWNRWATRWWRNHDPPSFLRFDTIPARDGLTHSVAWVTTLDDSTNRTHETFWFRWNNASYVGKAGMQLCTVLPQSWNSYELSVTDRYISNSVV